MERGKVNPLAENINVPFELYDRLLKVFEAADAFVNAEMQVDDPDYMGEELYWRHRVLVSTVERAHRQFIKESERISKLCDRCGNATFQYKALNGQFFCHPGENFKISCYDNEWIGKNAQQ